MNKALSAKDIATIAVFTALLLGGQALFAMVPGVEVVTVLILCFAYCFGATRAILATTAFSLLCGMLHGFDVKSYVLYLVYFNLFALTFALVGRKSEEGKISVFSVAVTELLFLALIGFSLTVWGVALLHISRVLRQGVKTLCILLLSLGGAGMVGFNAFLAVFFKTKKPWALAVVKVISVAVLAAVFTVGFTMLDNLLYPVFYGTWGEPAVAYFYASFPFMLPQTVSAILSVGVLFLPLTKILNKAAKKLLK